MDSNDSIVCVSYPDGSHYKGSLYCDFREGYGVHTWQNGEKYVGYYQQDKRHGKGSYTWPSGATYEGNFIFDKKEGLGTMLLDSGARFEGFYKKDERNGKGTLYYPNGQVDTGIWLGVHLICLLFEINESAPDYVSSSDLDTPELECRGTKSPKGYLERESQLLIQSSAEGDLNRVISIFKLGNVCVNVVDSVGRSALFAASSNGHSDVIKFLLCEGANINHLSDRGYSSLTAALHRLYMLQNCLVLNVQQGSLTPRKGTINSLSTVSIESHQDVDTLTPSSPSEVNPRDVFTTPRFFIGRQSDLEERGLYPELNGNSITRIISAPPAVNFIPNNTSPKGSILKKNTTYNSQEFTNIAESCNAKNHYNYKDNEVNNIKSENERIVLQAWQQVPISHSRLSMNDDAGEAFIGSASIFSNSSTSIHLDTDRQITGDPATTSSHHSYTPLKPAIVLSLESALETLLLYGASPNKSLFPMPALFYPVLAGDVKLSKRIIEAGADVNSRLETDQKSSGLLHYLCSQINTELNLELINLLLENNADPNIQENIESAGNLTSSSHPQSDILPGANIGSAGYTPLHKLAAQGTYNSVTALIVTSLISHGADTNIVSHGHSPISLAVLTRNQPVIDSLLEQGINLNIPLGPRICSALCVTTQLESQRLRTVQESILLFKRFLLNGANILQHIKIKDDDSTDNIGSIVDYAYCAFHEDRRCTELPFHSMTSTERQRYLARSKLLSFVSNIYRKISRATGLKISENRTLGSINLSNTIGNVYLEIDFQHLLFPEEKSSQFHLQTNLVSKSKNKRNKSCKVSKNSQSTISQAKKAAFDSTNIITFDNRTKIENFAELRLSKQHLDINYCDFCCRSIGVKLSVCGRCHLVCFCSRNCKLKAWEGWHKKECMSSDLNFNRACF